MPPSTDDTLPILTTISPITSSPLTTRSALTRSEVSPLVTRSKTAFKTFRNAHSLSARQSLVRDFLSCILARKDELAALITEEMGRPIRYTASEIETMVQRGEYLLSISSEALADVPGVPELGFTRFIRKEPVGVVLIMFAWNYPYLILDVGLVWFTGSYQGGIAV